MTSLTSVLIEYISTQTNARLQEDKLANTNSQLTNLILSELPQLNEHDLESLIPLLVEIVEPLFDQERIKGVRYIPEGFGGKYQARIELPNGSTPSLGTYTTVVEANAAMRAAAKVIELMSGEKVELSTDSPKEKKKIEANPDGAATVCPETGKVRFRGNLYDSFSEAYNTP